MSRPAPRARPIAVWPGVLAALLLVGVGVVGVRDFIVDRGWVGGTPWVTTVVADLDGQRPHVWVVIVAVVAVLLGLLILFAGLKRARRTHVGVQVDADLWLSRGALAELAQSVAHRQEGVVSATAEVRRGRKVGVSVVARDDAPVVLATIESAVEDALGDLTPYSYVISVREVTS